MRNGERYRGSCKTSNQRRGREGGSDGASRGYGRRRLPGLQKVPTLADFSDRFFAWMEALPADRLQSRQPGRYYRVGWQLLENTKRRWDATGPHNGGSMLWRPRSAAPRRTPTTLCARFGGMLKKAQEWNCIRTKPVIKLVEEFGREQIIEPWMEQKLLTVTAGERLTPKRHDLSAWAGSRSAPCC